MGVSSERVGLYLCKQPGEHQQQYLQGYKEKQFFMEQLRISATIGISAYHSWAHIWTKKDTCTPMFIAALLTIDNNPNVCQQTNG